MQIIVLIPLLEISILGLIYLILNSTAASEITTLVNQYMPPVLTSITTHAYVIFLGLSLSTFTTIIIWASLRMYRSRIIHSHKESWKQIRNRFRRESLAMKRIGMLRLSSIITILFSEISRLGLDLLSIHKTGRFQNPIKDIILYRLNKFLGSTQGLLQK